MNSAAPVMAMDVSPAISWKNKRKKSLYAEEAEVGFIFRKVHKPNVEEKVKEPLPNGVVQPLLVNGRHDSEPVLMNGYGDEVFDEEAMFSQDSTEPSISLDASLLGGGEGLKKELHKEVELKRFVAQLRKELVSVGGATSEEEVDKVLDGISQHLRESGSYFKYMEADGPDELLPHPLTEQLQEHIATLKTSTELYKRELSEWDQLLAKKRSELEQAKQNCESNKNINFSNLRPEDIAALKTYLTPDQLSHLDHPAVPVDQTFVQQATSHLQGIHSKLDSEVKEAKSHCKEMAEWLKSSAPDGDSMCEETPRTLFRSLKKGLV